MNHKFCRYILSASFLFATCAAALAANPEGKPAMKTENQPTSRPTTQPAACAVDENSACAATPWTGKTDAELRKMLTPEQYQIARHAGTERAFTGKYWNEHTKGIYHCAVCGQALFSSDTKFDSGTGWPSFYAPVAEKAVKTKEDRGHGMVRVEVECSQCGSHLGHVFDDGPPPTGLRYCMNSAVLNLVPDKENK